MSKPLHAIPLSLLDLVAVREGGTVADALAIALRTAQHAEHLGFQRYWLAEHHNMAGMASSACRSRLPRTLRRGGCSRHWTFIAPVFGHRPR